MSKKRIDYEAVQRAADSIKNKGFEPSLTTVCEELHLMTVEPEVSTYLEQWYHKQPEFRRSNLTPLTENIKINLAS